MLDKAPLARIALPFIAGIVLARLCGIGSIVAIVAVAAVGGVLFSISRATRRSPLLSIRAVPLLTSLVMLAALVAGWHAGSVAVAGWLDVGAINGRTVVARIDHARNRDFSMTIEATLLSCPDQHDALPQATPITVAIRANDYLLREGQLIAFQAQLQPICSLGNPEEFDYAAYMLQRGFRYSQQLEAGQYDVIGTRHNFFTRSRTLQRSITERIVNTHMEPATQRLLCTILLGDASFIEPETRTVYSQAGIAHILALSGLHMGIIIGILYVLLRPLCYLGLHRLRIVLIAIALLAYLYVTGMSPSATRAAIMSVFVLAAHFLYRRNSSLNALLAAAIAILVVSPNALYNAGFQLSFAAVLAILLFYQRLVEGVPVRSKVLYFWLSSLVLTTVATLGTVVISTYYFHTIPLLSVVSNLIVLPLLPFYLGAALLHTGLLCVGVEVPEFSAVLDFGRRVIDYVAATVSDVPFSSISYVHVSTLSLLLFALLYILVTVWFFNRRSVVALLGALATLLGIALVSLIEYVSLPASGMMVMNHYTATPIVTFSGSRCTVWCPDDSLDTAQFLRQNAGFISRYNLDPAEVTVTRRWPGNGEIAPPFAMVQGHRMAVVTSTGWRHHRAQKPVEVDYLVITSSYYGNVADLLRTIAPRQIVLSGAIYDDKAALLREELDTLKIPYHQLSTQGAIFLKK